MNDLFRNYNLNERGKFEVCMCKEAFDKLIKTLEMIGLDDERYKALVYTKLEEACFFAVKAISVNGKNNFLEDINGGLQR